MFISIKDAVFEFMHDKCAKGQWYTHKGEVYSDEADCFVREISDKQLEQDIFSYFHNSQCYYICACSVSRFILDFVAELKRHLNDAGGSEIYERLRQFEK